MRSDGRAHSAASRCGCTNYGIRIACEHSRGYKQGMSIIWKLTLALISLLAGSAYAERIDIDQVAVQRVGNTGPLVVLLGGSEGGFLNVTSLNDALVAEGFQVAELAYFGFQGGPPHLSEININEVLNGLQILAEQVSCVGVFGVSKGAELALLLSANSEIVDATVAMVPLHVVWQSSKISIVGASSWILHDKPLDYVPYDIVSFAAARAALNPNNALTMHINALENADAVTRSAIPIEQIRGPVLLQAPFNRSLK